MKNQQAVTTAYFKAKETWAQNLEPGDLVEDCRKRVLKITKVHPMYIKYYPLDELFWKLPQGYIERFLDFVDKYPGLRKLWNLFENQILLSWSPYKFWIDSDLELEDGYMCSALSCCDMPTLDQEDAYYGE